MQKGVCACGKSAPVEGDRLADHWPDWSDAQCRATPAPGDAIEAQRKLDGIVRMATALGKPGCVGVILPSAVAISWLDGGLPHVEVRAGMEVPVHPALDQTHAAMLAQLHVVIDRAQELLRMLESAP